MHAYYVIIIVCMSAQIHTALAESERNSSGSATVKGWEWPWAGRQGYVIESLPLYRTQLKSRAF